jgi:HSP20 family molecular chaperone IbpA
VKYVEALRGSRRSSSKRELRHEGEEKVKNQPDTAGPSTGHIVAARIGNAANHVKAISAAVSKRAFEIYQRQGRRPGRDQENWRAAEREILPPLTCGILRSKDNIVVEIACSALGAEDLEKIEVYIEPHRLILVGKRAPDPKSKESTNVYRVLPLKYEFDPNSVKLRQRGSLLEIEIRKSGERSKSAAAGKKSA